MADSDAKPEFRDPPPFAVETNGLRLAFQPSGPDRLAALLALIDGAQERLKVAFYIFATDECAVRVRNALVAAARRGVDVHVLLDGFGALADEAFFAPLVEAQGHFCRFIPRLTRRYLIRNHQKIVVADGRVAMLGGFNVENNYFAPPEEDGWIDLGFTVEGSVVERVEEWFDELEAWATNPRAQFRAIRRLVRRWEGGQGPIQLLIGGPATGLSSWARGVSRDLLEGDRLDMMMAYFSPPPRLQKRIQSIARKGRTRLVFPARSDNAVPRLASRAVFRKLLQAGARIWEFMPYRLHTKLIVIDDTTYLGSANFDFRSLYLNLEIVLRIEDAALAERMREFVAWHLPTSIEVTPEYHAARSTWFNRLYWRLCWFVVSMIDYSIARRLNFQPDPGTEGGYGA